jgi:hypothetical protein
MTACDIISPIIFQPPEYQKSLTFLLVFAKDSMLQRRKNACNTSFYWIYWRLGLCCAKTIRDEYNEPYNRYSNYWCGACGLIRHF